jgi:hypothetical protein
MGAPGDNGEGNRMADQCPKHEAVELLRRSRGPDAARQAEAVLPDPVDLRRDAALLVSLGLTMGQIMDDLGASP